MWWLLGTLAWVALSLLLAAAFHRIVAPRLWSRGQ